MVKKINSFLDKEFLESLKTTNRFINSRSIKIHPSSVRKAKPAIEEQKMQLAVKGRPAIPGVVDPETGEIAHKAIPSIQSRPAVPKRVASPFVPGGQFFHISTQTYEIICEVVAQFLLYGISPDSDLRLGHEFLNQNAYHQYVIGYFATDSTEFRKIYASIKK